MLYKWWLETSNDSDDRSLELTREKVATFEMQLLPPNGSMEALNENLNKSELAWYISHTVTDEALGVMSPKKLFVLELSAGTVLVVPEKYVLDDGFQVNLFGPSGRSPETRQSYTFSKDSFW